MKTLIIIVAFSISFAPLVSGQRHQKNIVQQFSQADSVLIVSHLLTNTTIVQDETNKRLGYRRLVIKNKPNYSIIKESIIPDKNSIDTLSQILLTPNRDSIIEDIKCFMPHHGILIFKKGKCSYFDICFGCRHFVTSKDLIISDELSFKTWQDLKTFYLNRNIQYEINKEDTILTEDVAN